MKISNGIIGSVLTKYATAMMHFKSSLKLLGLLICEAQWQLKDDCPQRERRLGGGDGVPGGLREHRDRASAYFGHAPFHWSTFRHFIIVHSRIFDRLCIPCKQFAHLFLLILLLTIILAPSQRGARSSESINQSQWAPSDLLDICGRWVSQMFTQSDLKVPDKSKGARSL